MVNVTFGSDVNVLQLTFIELENELIINLVI